MPPFNSRSPSQQSSEGTPQRELLTTTGVRVVVKAVPPPEPKPAPAPAPVERTPRAIILPLNQSEEERERFIEGLCREYGDTVRRMLLRRGDVLAESAKDLQQRVLMVLYAKVESEEPIDDVEAFLAGVVHNEVRNHKRRWRPPIEREADPDQALSADDPERAAGVSEQMEALERGLRCLPVTEAEVYRCAEMWGLTLEETARAVGRPQGTVAHQLERARNKIRDFVRACDRGEPPRR